MIFNIIFRASVGTDLSALGGFPAIQMKMLNSIYEQYAAATATTI
jgi:hypothetical protein